MHNNVIDIQREEATRSGGHAKRRRTNVALLQDFAFTPPMPPPQEARPKSDWPLPNIRQGSRTLPALHCDAPVEASSENDSWAYNHVWRDYKDVRGKDYVLSERHVSRINGTVQQPPSRSATPPKAPQESDSDSSDDSSPDFRRRQPGRASGANRPSHSKRPCYRRPTGRSNDTHRSPPAPAPSAAQAHYNSDAEHSSSLASDSTQLSGNEFANDEPA